MSDPTPASVPAGWYPSPDGDPRRRWWNGIAWTADMEQLPPAPQPPAGAPLPAAAAESAAQAAPALTAEPSAAPESAASASPAETAAAETPAVVEHDFVPPVSPEPAPATAQSAPPASVPPHAAPSQPTTQHPGYQPPAFQQPAHQETPPQQALPQQAAHQQSAYQQSAYQQPAAQQPYGTPAATPVSAAKRNVTTPWIWLIALMPIIPIFSNALVDYSPLFLADPYESSAQFDAQFAVYASPAYLLSGFGGFLVYGLSVLFAFLDRRELMARGVDRPFHWAWTFIMPIVYSIGRGVIARRRTGTGYAPMFTAIGVYALGVVVGGFTIAGVLIGLLNSPAYML